VCNILCSYVSEAGERGTGLISLRGHLLAWANDRTDLKADDYFKINPNLSYCGWASELDVFITRIKMVGVVLAVDAKPRAGHPL